MQVLGIESSCDETGAAIYDTKSGLLAHQLHSQIKVHAKFGGVVPELASRDHIRKTLPLVSAVLEDAKLMLKDLDGIAYTAGPGLVGALFVGASVARSLAYALNIPAIAVHHMEAHLLAPMLEQKPPKFPFVALLVSGGHTLLVKVAALGEYEILGESLDDAVGEAFDKVAKMLDLAYPGGPAVEQLAKQGNSKRFHFPRPMIDRPGLDFSYSGLKTYVLNTIKQYGKEGQTKADIAAAFQDAVIDTIKIKCKRALIQTNLTRLIIAGGVGANQAIRAGLISMVNKLDAEVYYPRLAFCTDNGAMIAYTGAQKLLQGLHDDLSIQVYPRWRLL